MKNIDTLVEDIYGVMDGKSLHDPALVDSFGTEVGEILKRRLKEDRYGTPTLRMSNIGRPLRQLWYEINGYPSEPLSGQTKFKFLYGDLIEAMVITLAKVAGHDVTRLQEEIEVGGIKGHIDGVIDGVLVDVKSCSEYSYNKFKDGTLAENDAFGYIGQLSGYRAALGGIPARFIAINKVVGSICTLELPSDEYLIHERIALVRETVGSAGEPERCYEPQPVSKADKSGNLVLGVGCSYCGWKEHCWRDANNNTGLKTIVYSTGPKYFVHVEKEPRVKSTWHEFEVKS